MIRNKLEQLIRKLCSMQLEVPGAVYHIYQLQCALNRGGKDKDYLYLELQWELGYWCALVDNMDNQSNHLDNILQQDLTHLGLCDASVIGPRGIWIDLDKTKMRILWHKSWTTNITTTMILDNNPDRIITNLYLELTTHILHKYTLLSVTAKYVTDAPRSGPDNIPTAYWIMRKTSTINLVVVYLLYTHAIHSWKFLLNPSIFCHHNPNNFMTDDSYWFV